MLERTVSKRWSSALLILATQENNVEQIESQLLTLKDVFQKDKAFRLILTHPRIPKETKKNVMRKIIEPGILLKFLELLIEKRRAELIPDIADVFDELAYEFRGVVRVNVKTFSDLDEATKSKLLQKVSDMIGKKKVELKVQVDKSIMGGLWIKIGDTVIDGSVLSKLNILKDRLYRRH